MERLCRSISIAPLCRKYYSISSYAYCENNPIKYIDPDGRKIVIGTWWQRFMGKLGLDSYVSKVSEQFKRNNMDSRRIESVYNELENSELVFNVLPLSEYPLESAEEKGNHIIPDSKIERGKRQGATLYYDPDMEVTPKGKERNPCIGLAHETGHLDDFNKGKVLPVDRRKALIEGDKVEIYKIELNEQNSLELENNNQRNIEL